MLSLKKIISFRTSILFLAGILVVSCKSNFVLLTIENVRPASDELPADIQSITLMNRSMNSQFDNYQEDSLQVYFYRKNYQLSKIVLDSTAADTTIRALAELLFESGRYDVVVPLERNLRREPADAVNNWNLSETEQQLAGDLSYELIPDTLNSSIVAKICESYDTDALMVLERFSTKVLADYSTEKYLNATTGVNYSYYASLDLRYDALFRIYQPGKTALVKEIDLTDTIYWESADYSQERLFGKLPSIKQALISAGIRIALEVDSKLSPTWIPEKRGYFLFNPKNDKGQEFMNERLYEEAERYWAELAHSTNKKIRSKAEYNLALISELNGDLNGAIDWGLKSFYSYYRKQTETYLKKLQNRKKTI